MSASIDTVDILALDRASRSSRSSTRIKDESWSFGSSVDWTVEEKRRGAIGKSRHTVKREWALAKVG
jgi:hypothetical protein